MRPETMPHQLTWESRAEGQGYRSWWCLNCIPCPPPDRFFEQERIAYGPTAGLLCEQFLHAVTVVSWTRGHTLSQTLDLWHISIQTLDLWHTSSQTLDLWHTSSQTLDLWHTPSQTLDLWHTPSQTLDLWHTSSQTLDLRHDVSYWVSEAKSFWVSN